jgi:hypothetical protein
VEKVYNGLMTSKTFHVYPSKGIWEVKREGTSAKAYLTKREAVEGAWKSIKIAGSGQFVVHAKDGGIKEHRSYKMTVIQDPPKRSSRAADIARAVGRVALRRIQSDTSRERSSQN